MSGVTGHSREVCGESCDDIGGRIGVSVSVGSIELSLDLEVLTVSTGGEILAVIPSVLAACSEGAILEGERYVPAKCGWEESGFAGLKH